jgi:hypothetical protein
MRTLIIGGSAVLAYGVWLATTYRRPADPSQVLTPFLLLIAAEMTHMGEEYLTDFPGQIRELFGAPVSFDLQTFTLAWSSASTSWRCWPPTGYGAETAPPTTWCGSIHSGRAWPTPSRTSGSRSPPADPTSPGWSQSCSRPSSA